MLSIVVYACFKQSLFKCDEGIVDFLVDDDLVQVDYAALLVNENWLSEACGFAHGHAASRDEVDFMTVVLGRLNDLPLLKAVVCHATDYLVDECLLTAIKHIAEDSLDI